MNCAGPLFNHKVEFNYALILVDCATRWPAAYAFKSLTARNVCNAILQRWQFTACGNGVSSDCGSNFTSQLTQECLKRLGRSPRYISPGHPKGNGLAERMASSVKSIISKLASDHSKNNGLNIWGSLCGLYVRLQIFACHTSRLPYKV
jgi:transposase InsO family protein